MTPTCFKTFLQIDIHSFVPQIYEPVRNKIKFCQALKSQLVILLNITSHEESFYTLYCNVFSAGFALFYDAKYIQEIQQPYVYLHHIQRSTLMLVTQLPHSTNRFIFYRCQSYLCCQCYCYFVVQLLFNKEDGIVSADSFVNWWFLRVQTFHLVFKYSNVSKEFLLRCFYRLHKSLST